MTKKNAFTGWIKNNWLICLIAAQPLLDALAYWTQNEVATVAGYIRLVIMVALPLFLLFTLKKKKRFVIAMLVIGLYALLHILNCYRVGYLAPAADVAYMARVLQMPILAICFVYLIRDERAKEQALRGILIAGAITLALLVLALVTGTSTPTYETGLGVSGWVIDSNRCANSILCVTLSVFAVMAAAKSEKTAAMLLLPAVVTLLLIANGTKACYLGLYAILCGYAAFVLLRRAVTGERFKAAFLVTLVALMIVGAAVYPISPRHQEDILQANAARRNQNELAERLAALGYDVDAMTLEEKLNDPVVYAIFEEYYVSLIGYVIPDMFTRFDARRVLIKYNMTTSGETLINVRLMKTTYASLIWEDSDTLTHILGFESSQVCYPTGDYDMENDWPALLYYYGYLGLGLYIAFVLYFVYLIVRRLLRDFKGGLTLENFALLLCLLLQLGLAQFSGAVLRRPNVSIYLSLVLALIFYQTVRLPVPGKGEGERA